MGMNVVDIAIANGYTEQAIASISAGVKKIETIDTETQKIIRITALDNTTYDLTFQQPADGEKGDKGDKGNTGDRGAIGVGVVSVAKTGTSGLVDSYTMTFSDGSTTTFSITNGANIERLSQLENDENFITITVNNLVNYYTKNEVYNKSKIDELLRNVGAGLGVMIVTELPTEDISGTTIYLVNTSDNNYNQYMYISDEWANLGSTEIDLSDYYTKTQVDNLLLTYIDADTLTTILEDYVKKSELADVATSNDYNDLDNLPTIPSTDDFMKARQDLGEVDLDECTTEGVYTISTNSANLPNITIDGTSADLQVSNIETVVSQTVRLVSNSKPLTYSRCLISDNWTDWEESVTMDKVDDTVTNAITDVIKVLSITVPTSQFTDNFKLDSLIVTPSGYDFLCWVSASSEGWVMQYPIYFANPTTRNGYVFTKELSTLPRGGSEKIRFTYLVVKS